MRKKIFVILFMFFAFLGVIKAEYTCVYDATIPPTDSLKLDKKELEAKIIIKPEENIITSDKFLGSYNSVVIDSKINSFWTDSKLIKTLEGKNCPNNVMVCYGQQVTIPGGSRAVIGAVIINNTISSSLNYPFTFSVDNVIYDISDETKCQIGTINKEKTTGIIVKVDFPCEYVEKKLTLMNDLYCKINESGCSLEEYNNVKQQLKQYCVQILKYQSYTNDCVTACLNLGDSISLIEGKSEGNGKCGFSEKLILFIANIVKWIKYIIPVIVIVLGILDFIQAIAADKDDGMKKAQGRFVKRLIAAALIFIIPFIIEFVLDKMGFGANGCGIIDL